MNFLTFNRIKSHCTKHGNEARKEKHRSKSRKIRQFHFRNPEWRSDERSIFSSFLSTAQPADSFDREERRKKRCV